MRHGEVDYVNAIPGGWYGCNPDQWGRGHVVVDGAKAVAAIRWILRERKVRVLEEGVKVTTDGGILLPFVVKGAAMEIAPGVVEVNPGQYRCNI